MGLIDPDKLYEDLANNLSSIMGGMDQTEKQ